MSWTPVWLTFWESRRPRALKRSTSRRPSAPSKKLCPGLFQEVAPSHIVTKAEPSERKRCLVLGTRSSVPMRVRIAGPSPAHDSEGRAHHGRILASADAKFERGADASVFHPILIR